MDFDGPDIEPEEVQAAMKQKHLRTIQKFRRLIQRTPHQDFEDVQSVDPEKQGNEEPHSVEASHSEQVLSSDSGNPIVRPNARRHVSFYDEATTVVPTEGPTRPPSAVGCVTDEKLAFASPAPTVTDVGRDGYTSRPLTPIQEAKQVGVASPVVPVMSYGLRALNVFKGILQSLCMPASLAIIISFPVALIQPLKALFVVVDGYYMPSAPDGHPPLAVFYDFTEFMGAASVPLNLICLGSALARLNVPRSQWPSLPLGAIFSLAVGRMLLLPIFGVLICEALIHVDFISREDKVLQFVCM